MNSGGGEGVITASIITTATKSYKNIENHFDLFDTWNWSMKFTAHELSFVSLI